MNNQNRAIGFDYKELSVPPERASLYIDGYGNFGWQVDENLPPRGGTVRLKRDRKVLNKAELTRLERNFASCMAEIEALERAKTSTATLRSVLIGLVGTAFLAGSVFAVTHTPPLIVLTVMLGLPGLLGWTLPIPLHGFFVRRATQRLNPLVEAKYDEVYEVCEKGTKLL